MRTFFLQPASQSTRNFSPCNFCLWLYSVGCAVQGSKLMCAFPAQRILLLLVGPRNLPRGSLRGRPFNCTSRGKLVSTDERELVSILRKSGCHKIDPLGVTVVNRTTIIQEYGSSSFVSRQVSNVSHNTLLLYIYFYSLYIYTYIPFT